ncbi:MAG TPA: hypothetical protein VHU61_18765 [Solirubrobacteraceae bacterium]|jgi:hypothetical protein|nr:hypothetical protein [Solirubrobacteraceae bacterium]
MRRSVVAAIAVGGSLAVASSASAIPVPIGASSDAAYSGTGTPTSVYSLYNATVSGLIEAQNLIVGANGVAAANSTTPPDTNFTSDYTTASQLTSSTVTEIATDIANATYASDYEYALCIATEESNGVSQGQAFADCDTYPSAPAGAYVTAFTTKDQPAVASAAANWPQLSELVGFLGSAAGIMQSADSASVSSSGTVVSTTDPFEYDVKLSAPAGGYIVPSAFALTFPAGLSVNTALVGDEVNAAANGTTAAEIAAIEANPSGTSIGTVTLTSPLADEFGGSNNQFVGKIYVVTTGASSGQGSATQPYLELWFTNGIYDIGSFPSSLAFPLTLNFGEATVTGLGQEPLPINSLELNFPAATSPVKTSSCTTLGTAGGTATDEIAGLAYEFGDTGDGVSSVSGTPAAVNLAATATAVTNQCTATTTAVKPSLSGSASGLNKGKPTFTLKVKNATAFSSETVSLPSGLKFVKTTAKKLAKEVSASGGKIKSVKVSRGKLVVTFKSKVTSVTLKSKKGLVSETAALLKKIKKHKTKKLTFKVKAGSKSLSTSVKA